MNPSRGNQVVQKLPRIHARIEAPACDEHGDFPQADVAAREFAIRSTKIYCLAGAGRKARRIERVIDQRMGVKNDHVHDHVRRPRPRRSV